MFLLELMRYIRGYVKFSAKGVFIERFLNLAARDRVPIWDGRKRGDQFTGKTVAGSYIRLRPHAKKAGVKIRVIEKHGAPFKRYRYRKRTGLLIGFAVFFVFLFMMSRFIWRIDVSGSELVGESEILSALEELGVSQGKLRSSIDVRGVERRALLKLDGLSWIALNIQGSTVHVAVRESEPSPMMIDPHMPCNVVASKSGQIVSMTVYDGQPLKAVGDTVLEGDIIISGITQDRLGQNMFRHARAQVKARVQDRIVVEVPLTQNQFVETGEIRTRYFLHAFGWDLPLFLPRKIPQPYHVERGNKMLTISGTELPAGIFSEKYFLMRETAVTYSEADAKLLALKELDFRQKSEFGNSEIIEKNAAGVLSDGAFTITTDYVCLMDISKEVEILKSE